MVRCPVRAGDTDRYTKTCSTSFKLALEKFSAPGSLHYHKSPSPRMSKLPYPGPPYINSISQPSPNFHYFCDNVQGFHWVVFSQKSIQLHASYQSLVA
ncbi:hypothetical protein SISSUDRAFT_154479 [Sistotremastrum suecicum HHB10207 ss-3]|uniref:Uncharacterized protein n=1 Tax=Sistotremastrum suecicum HHB10207 ss-3 TaxID=1314776 RepID=A0A166ARN0_9AGAM|nr:hypothetical protein SISSUDRAFT_154479 [Sistotremastrum suecicum HHB10207 ss-3]